MSAWICRQSGFRAPPPERRICVDRGAHLADQLQAVAHGEGRPLHHRADQVRPAVADGQADPAAPGVGVEVRGALAGQVGQEEQALGSPGRRWRPRRSAGSRGRSRCCFAAATSARPSSLRNHCRLPPAASTTPKRSAQPGTAWQNRWSRPSGSKPSSVGVGEDDARGPHRRRDDPGPDDPVADGAGRLVAAAADDRRAGRQAGRLGGRGRLTWAETSGLSKQSGRSDAVEVELAEQLVAPAAVGHVEQEGPRGVADLGGEASRRA